jgi:hypothetical protein
VADLLLARNPQEAVLTPDEFGDWLTTCSRRARTGSGLWASIGTQYGEAVRAQAGALCEKQLGPLSVDDAHVEAAVRVAYTRGCRGFFWRSNSPLDAADAVTRRRAALVELINRRLQLVAPWIAGGTAAGEIDAADERTTAAVLVVDRARLIVPGSRERGGRSREQGDTQRVPGRESNGAEVSQPGETLVVPGIPDSNQAFLLTPVALRPLATKRVAGGMRLTMGTPSDGLIVITQDPQVIAGLRQRIAREGPATIRLARELAKLEAESITATRERLAPMGYDCGRADALSAAANRLLRQVDALLPTGRVEGAEALLTAARGRLAQAADELRRSVGPGAAGDPLALAVETLVERAVCLRGVAAFAPGDNLLYAGDFEDLDQMTQLGWRHFDASAGGIVGRAELSGRDPRHGRYSLRVAAEATPGSDSPMNPHQSAVRIVSPPMRVDVGQLVEITGWTRVSEAGPDWGELVISDSFGGPELALRLSTTPGWQSFRVVRAATASELEISFELVGAGVSELDAVMVRPLVQAVARRLPPANPATSARGQH